MREYALICSAHQCPHAQADVASHAPRSTRIKTFSRSRMRKRSAALDSGRSSRKYCAKFAPGQLWYVREGFLTLAKMWILCSNAFQ